MKNKTLVTCLTATFAIVLSSTAPFSRADDYSKMRDANLRAAQAWMDFQLKDQFTPGGSVALVHDQDVIWNHAYGYANIENNQAMTVDHSYSICSISKLFTSIGVMTLVEEGKIELDAPLSNYLAAFEITPSEDTNDYAITIRQLLSHSAGLPRETSGTHWNVIYDMPTSDAVVNMLTEQERLYSPHSNFQYSNLGMSLLGTLISSVSGQDYHDYIKAEVLDPLNLDGISSELPMDYDKGRYSVGYQYHNGVLPRKPWAPYQMRGYAPAAGYAASVMDLADFASWHFRVLDSGEEEVLSKESMVEMQRVQFTDPFDPNSPKVGLGYFFRPLGGKMAFGHGGYCPGYRAQLLMRPQDKLALVGMVNTNDVNPAMIINGIADIAGASVLASVNQSEDSEEENEAKVI